LRQQTLKLSLYWDSKN